MHKHVHLHSSIRRAWHHSIGKHVHKDKRDRLTLAICERGWDKVHVTTIERGHAGAIFAKVGKRVGQFVSDAVAVADDEEVVDQVGDRVGLSEEKGHQCLVVARLQRSAEDERFERGQCPRKEVLDVDRRNLLAWIATPPGYSLE